MIKLADGLEVHAEELATQVTAAFGMRGSGKSNAMAVIAEGMLAAKVQVVVLDYVGIWPSLRLKADGKTPSKFDIPVFGGPQGDLRLDPLAGKLVAETLARTGSSAVLDVSAWSKGQRARFGADFAEAIFDAKKLNPGPCWLLLEEAQRWVPQSIRQGQEFLFRMLGAFEEIAEVGRNYGLGLGLITQRPQKVNVEVRNLAEVVFGFQLNGVHERKAIKELLQEKGAEGRDEINNELPSLPKGEAFVWSPSWLRVFGRFKFRKKSTYDAGATPLKARAAVKIQKIDLVELEYAMGALVAETKANDPQLLKAEVKRLEAEVKALKSVQTGPSKPGKTVTKVEIPKGMERAVQRLQDQGHNIEIALRAMADGLADHRRIFSGIWDGVRGEVGKRESTHVAANGKPEHVEVVNSPDAETQRLNTALPTFPGMQRFSVLDLPNTLASGEVKLGLCARTLLACLAQLGGRASDVRLGAFSGYSVTSSGFGNSLTDLKNAGLVVGTPDMRTITPSGQEAAGPQPPAPTGKELLDFWLNRRGRGALGLCARKFLQTIFEYGTISRAQLQEVTSYKQTSSGFGNSLTDLKKLGLVHGPAGGELTIGEAFR